MTDQQFNELKELIQRIENRQIELEKQVEYLAKTHRHDRRRPDRRTDKDPSERFVTPLTQEMAAPEGNEFWKLRSKHGRDKLFSSPEALKEAAYEYFQWAYETPLIEIDFRGKDADMVELPKMRAFTLHGLCIYLGCNSKYFWDFKKALADKEDPVSKGFSEVITHIEDIIYERKYTGAASGFFNPTIIARDLGLQDATKTEMSGKLTWKEERTYEAPNQADAGS
jgi:hypothetical protein